jgi:hypothetical protein
MDGGEGRRQVVFEDITGVIAFSAFGKKQQSNAKASTKDSCGCNSK